MIHEFDNPDMIYEADIELRDIARVNLRVAQVMQT